jgi:uncharacterized protein YbcV (DUF1398 family)
MYSYLQHQPFTLDQLKTAHAKVKSGADFPTYIQEISKLGVESYETFVTDGHTVFNGAFQFQITSAPKYTPLEISDATNPAQFTTQLKIHQNGGSDYLSFIRQCAENGVEKWMVSIKDMTCTYYDKTGDVVLIETIPTP